MAVKELSDGGPDGTRLGQDSSDLIGFHGASPSDQAAAVSSLAASAANSTIATAVNAVIVALREKGLIAT